MKKKNILQKLRNHTSKKNWIEIAVMTVIFIIACVLVYEITIIPRMSKPHLITAIKTEDASYTLQEGDILEQRVVYEQDMLLSVGTKILIDLDEDAQHEGTILAEVIDANNNAVIASSEYDLHYVQNDQILNASMPVPTPGYQGMELIYRLSVSEMGEDEVSVSVADEAVSAQEFTINGETQDSALFIRTSDRQLTYWKYYFLAGAMLVYAMLLWTYVTLAILRLKKETVFLGVGIVLAVIYLFLLPPRAVPDEQQHMLMAYEYVNELFGTATEDSMTVNIDVEDYKTLKTFDTTPSLLTYDKLKNDVFKTTQAEGSKVVHNTYNHAAALSYIPGMIGITIGRLTGVNGYQVWILGRLFSMLFYILFMYLTIKITPVAKGAAFLLAILPMTIQQCGSYSYDGIVIECTFLMTALLLRFIYEREKPIKLWEILLYAYCCMQLGVCKGGCYLPLIVLTLFIPLDRMGSKKKTWIFKIGMFAVAAVVFLAHTMSYVSYVLAPTGEQTMLSYIDAEAYMVSDVLADPWIFITPVLKTVIWDGPNMFLSMFGTQMGWLDINISAFIPIIFFILILVAGIGMAGEEDRYVVSMKAKIAIILLCGMSIGMVFTSMFLDWTPKGASQIWGIQGRYFTPLLPALLLLFRTKAVSIKKYIQNHIIFLGVSLQCLAIFCILLSLEGVL